MAYDSETLIKPFWAKTGGFTGGRDPLGIQNSSVSTYATLLPGLTNLTERLRYYGFYTWLLDCYENQDKFKDSYKQQYTFIRRAEYTMALYTAIFESGLQNVAGIDFATRNKTLTGRQKYYHVDEGADKTAETEKGSVYWDYSSGAFGQYYSATLINLGLVASRENFYFITEQGKALSNAYQKSISKPAMDNFLDILYSGRMLYEQAEKLKPFSFAKIKEKHQEWHSYIQMLFSDDRFLLNSIEDGATFSRKNTCIEYLKFIKAKTISPFPVYMFNNKGFIGSDERNSTRIGWFYYYTNELVHYSLETIFYGLLKVLEVKNRSISEFLNEVGKATWEEIKRENKLQSKNTLKDLIIKLSDEKPTEKLSLIGKLISRREVRMDNDAISKIFMRGIELFLTTYIHVQPFLEKFKEFSLRHRLTEKNGNALQLFNTLITPYLDKRISEFIDKAFYKIINDHIFIAFQKMSSSDVQVHKVLLEGNQLIHIETVQPNFTNPRINSLRLFFEDLSLIKKDGTIFELTETGKEILNTYK